VRPATAPPGREDRERHAHQEPEGGGGQGQAERDRRALANRFGHRLAGAQRHPEVALRDPPEPARVLHDQGPVETHALADRGELLLARVLHADQRHRGISGQQQN